MDGGFAASRAKRDGLSRQLSLGPEYEQLRRMQLSTSFLRGGLQVAGLDFGDFMSAADKAKIAAVPTVADRSFDPHTHCPAGHVGWHFVGDKSTDGDRTLVARTCRYARCDRSWSEGAFTEDARVTERATGHWS